MNMRIMAVLGLLMAIGGGVFLYAERSAAAPQAADQGAQKRLSTAEPLSARSQSASSTSYTLAEVAGHNSASSCWTAINGKVYDVTSWINQHPGGPDAILSLCGTDGSAVFNTQHGGQHRPASELAGFYIAGLSQ